jgi:hypothetical protein
MYNRLLAYPLYALLGTVRIIMGCHTWYRKPLVKGKENVQKYLREKIDTMRKKDYWNDECEQEAILSLNAIDVLDENMDEGIDLDENDNDNDELENTKKK